MIVRESARFGDSDAAVAMDGGQEGRLQRFSMAPFPNSQPLTSDPKINFTQDLGREPTEKIVAPHHRPPLPASKTSSVPIPRPFH